MESIFSSLKTERTARKHQERSQGGCVRLHRAVLQCDPASFDDRISETALAILDKMRDGSQGELIFPNPDGGMFSENACSPY
jgi:hypothetical protein